MGEKMTSITKFTEALRFILRTEYYSEWEQQNTEKTVLQALKKSKTVLSLVTPNHCPECLGKGKITTTFGRMFAQRVCNEKHVWYTKGTVVDGHYRCMVVNAKEVTGWKLPGWSG